MGNNGIFSSSDFLKGLIYNNIGYVIMAEELLFLLSWGIEQYCVNG